MYSSANIRVPWDGWRIVRMIGRGSFGTVYEIERDLYGTVQKAAMKVISVPESNERLDDLYGSGLDEENISTWCSKRIEDIVKEYNVMSRLKGKTNIVSCEDIDVAPHTNDPGADIYIRMEKLTSLTKLLSLMSKRDEMLSDEDREILRKLRPDHRRFTEEDVIKLGKDISKALELCEKNNIVHRDIKPENILISDDGDYKLGDFGTARKLDHTTAATFTGTERYMAPEVIKGGKTGRDVDTYALGLVMYRLLNRGRLPFYPLTGIPTAEQIEQAQQRRLAGEPFDPPADGSPELKALVMKACAYDRKDRFQSAADMSEQIRKAEEIMTERTQNVIPPPVDYYRVTHRPVSPDDDEETQEIPEEETVALFQSEIDATAAGPILLAEDAKDDTAADNQSEPMTEIFTFRDAAVSKQNTPLQSSGGEKHNRKYLIIAACIVLALLVGIIGTGLPGSHEGGGGSGDDSTAVDDTQEKTTPLEEAAGTSNETFTSVTREFAKTKEIWGDTTSDSYNPEAEENYISNVNSYSEYPRDDQGHPLTDNGLVFLKYAIDDFDGDGLLEWAVCRYDLNQDKDESFIPCVEVDLYYYYGSAYSSYHGTEFRGKNFDPDTVTFYNNMVWIEEFDKEGKHYTYVHLLDWFEDEKREALIKTYCPEHEDGLVYIDDGSGKIIREEAFFSLGDYEDTKTVLTREEYESEIAELTKDAEIIHPDFKEYIPE